MIIASLAFLFYFIGWVSAASYDQELGTWTEVYENGTDVSSNSSVALDASDGTLKLINSSGDFGPPYATSGYVITTNIMPTSVAEWGNISFDADTPSGTSVKIQVYDESDKIFPDSKLANNSNGFVTSPFNITELPVESSATGGSAKFARIRLKITLTTSDTSVTPTFSNLTLNWTVSRGDLSASPLASTAWPVTDVDKNGSRHTPYYSDSSYRTIRWTKSQEGRSGRIVRGTGDVIYSKPWGLLSSYSNLYAVNRSDGSSIWEKPIAGYGYSGNEPTLSKKETLHISDVFHDILLSYNTSDGSLMWTYQFGGGHSNAQVAIDDGGVLYTIRQNGDFTIYAFYPNGSVKWINTTDPTPDISGDAVSTSQIVFDSSDALYVGTSTYVGEDYTGYGQLYAFNTSDGSLIWQYATGDIYYITPIVDPDGTIYTAQSSSNVSNIDERQMYAVYPNGSLKWARSIGLLNDSWGELSLRSDGVLLAERVDPNMTLSLNIEAVNTTDGSLLWSSSNISSFGLGYSEVFSDGQNNFYFTSTGWDGSTRTNTSIYYYDDDYSKKWELYQSGNYHFYYPTQDEDGRVYGSFFNAGSTATTLFALFPWTLFVSTNSELVNSSDQITFTVNTSMKQTNGLSGSSNYVHVVMDYGEKILLSYDSDLDENISVWTANYTVPSNVTTDNHTFTVEAGAAGIQTDITTSFDSPATNSGNTGINTTWSFNVSDGAGPEITLDDPSDGTSTASSTLGFNFTATELYLDTCELWGNWSDWHLNQSYDGFVNETTQNFTNISLPEGNYIWNVWCNDTSSNSNFSVSNYTFRIDSTAPTVNLQNPVDGETFTSSSMTFTYQVSDLSSISSCALYINNSQNSTSSSISKDTNQTFSATLFNDEYEWYVKCTDGASNSDSSATRYLTQRCTESWSCTDWGTCTDGTQVRTCADSNNCPAQANKPAENQTCGGDGGTGGGGGGSGGGGAEIAAQEDQEALKQNFSLNKKEIRVEVTQGETVQESFRIRNDGTETLILNLEISDDLKGYVVLSEDALALSKGEDQNVNVNFLAPATLEPKSYSGRIVVKSEVKKEYLSVQMIVKRKEALFDVKVKIPEKFKTVFPGESVVADITLLNVGKIGQVDVDVYYTVKDQEGTVVTFSKETIGVEVATSFTKTLTLLQDVTAGNYTYFVKITYKDTSTTGEDYFMVKREIPIIPRFVRERFYELLVWVVGGLLLLVIFFGVRERHLKTIIKEVKRKEERDIKRLEVRERKLERVLSKIKKREKK